MALTKRLLHPEANGPRVPISGGHCCTGLPSSAVAWEVQSGNKSYLESRGVEKKWVHPRPGDPQTSGGPLGPSFLIPICLLLPFPPSA